MILAYVRINTITTIYATGDTADEAFMNFKEVYADTTGEPLTFDNLKDIEFFECKKLPIVAEVTVTLRDK